MEHFSATYLKISVHNLVENSNSIIALANGSYTILRFTGPNSMDRTDNT